MDKTLLAFGTALLVLIIADAVRIRRKNELFSKGDRQRMPDEKKSMAEKIAAMTEEEAAAMEENKMSLEERLKTVESIECCGTHSVCEKEQMIRALRQRIDYFDDEELDAYAGTAAEDYTDEQTDEFREILYTMQPAEIEDWLKSLELRHVSLPLGLKDEVCMLIAEARSSRTASGNK